MSQDRSPTLDELVRRLRSRAWDDRQHRELREQAADAIDELLARPIIAPSAIPSAWIRVEDRLPEHDGYIEVLTADARGMVYACDYWSEDKSFWPSNGKGEYWASAYDDITHWMPLPEAPK